VLVGLALGVPVGVVVYWLVEGGTTTLPASSSIAGASLLTAGYAAAAGALATLLALRWPCWRCGITPVDDNPGTGTFVVRRSRGSSSPWPWSTSPSGRRPLYQTTPLLIVGHAIVFFQLALVVRTSVAQRPWPSRTWPARSGAVRLAVWWQVVLPW
jgi:hypothetical protein